MDEQGLLKWPTWVGVVVEDLTGQRRFWGDLLGVPEDRSGTDFVAFELGDGRSFELIERSAEPQYDRLRFQVGFDVENIEAARDELIRRGVEQISEIFPDGIALGLIRGETCSRSSSDRRPALVQPSDQARRTP